MDASQDKKLKLINSLINSDSLRISDLISGRVFTAEDIKNIRFDGNIIDVEVCDKEIHLVVDDEILSCFTKEELNLIQSELEMEFPFAIISIIEGTEHTIVTRGLSTNELDMVTYNIRRIFEESIARLNG